ncbi:MAG TPA: hypothetical protein VNJ04_16295 [Gemmatimonadaceae bacterium]|nr:hypothetical protein [Gemmatimonadaceae bacterium]
MQNRDGHQKGPQDHAEGQHGAKTRSKILEQLHSRNGTAAKQNGNGNGKAGEHHGAHRLVEERKQHDAAEKRSEKTRLSRDIERGHGGPPRIS